MHLCIPELSTAPGTWWEGRKGRRKKERKEKGREEEGKRGWESGTKEGEERVGERKWVCLAFVRLVGLWANRDCCLVIKHLRREREKRDQRREEEKVEGTLWR